MLYIHTIFAPTEEHYLQTMASVRSFVQYYHKNKYAFKVVLVGYCRYTKWYRDISDMISKIADSEIIRVQTNKGKGYCINHAIKMYGRRKQYIWTCDHDIVYLLRQKDIAKCAVRVFEKYTDVGIVAPMQIGDGCHLMDSLRLDKKLLRPVRRNSGVAGGNWIIRMKAYKKTRGHLEYGIYGGHDGTLNEDMWQAGYKSVIIPFVEVYHPIRSNTEYERIKALVRTGVKSKVDKKVLSKALSDFWLASSTKPC